jgi:hypothetical protein
MCSEGSNPSLTVPWYITGKSAQLTIKLTIQSYETKSSLVSRFRERMMHEEPRRDRRDIAALCWFRYERFLDS